MSGGGNPFYKIAAQDSRNLADLFNKVGFQAGEDEAKHNVQNPGRAITKAAISAATWYLGGLAGDALGAGSSAGSAAGTASNVGGTALGTTSDALAASQAFGNLSGATTQQLMQQAIQNAAQQGATSGTANALGSSLLHGAENSAGKGLLSQASQGLKDGVADAAYRTALSPLGAGGQQAQMLAAQTADFGPEGLGLTMQSAGNAQGLNPLQQAFAKYGGNYLGANAGTSGSSGKVGDLALKLGMNSLQPQQPQGPMQAPPRQQGPQEPLPLPYQNSLTTGQSSLSNVIPPGMSVAEYLRRKQLGLI